MSLELSVVIPIFNEERELWAACEGLSVHLDETVGAESWQFVLVDNGSVDGTPEVVARVLRRWRTSVEVQLPRPNYGKALRAGLERAEAGWAYVINVDFWDPVFLGWAFRHRHDYDLIIGSKRADATLNEQTKYRRVLSWGLNSILQVFFGFIGTDTHGQKILNLESMRPIVDACVMHRGQFDTEFTLRALRHGLWIAEAPVPIVETRRQRNWMVRKIAQNLWDIWRLRRVVHQIPYAGPIRYHRWAREDMLGGTRQSTTHGSDVVAGRLDQPRR